MHTHTQAYILEIKKITNKFAQQRNGQITYIKMMVYNINTITVKNMYIYIENKIKLYQKISMYEDS